MAYIQIITITHDRNPSVFVNGIENIGLIFRMNDMESYVSVPK